MEKWSLYTIDRQKTNQTKLRGEKFNDDEFHLVVHTCILNSQNQLLIQQRQVDKVGWPNLWDVTVGGSAVENENSREAIERELFEELGLKLDFNGIRPKFTINFSFGFDDFYIVRQDVDLSLLTLQTQEVQAVKWASETEILKMIEQGEFIPYRPQLISLIFNFSEGYGLISEVKHED